MAQINTPINPTQDPSYAGYSKPITQPEGNKFFESLFKGVGDVFSTAVKGVDFLIKDNITREVEGRAGAEQDAYIKSLEMSSEAVSGRSPLDIVAEREAREAGMPSDVKNVGKYLEMIKQSREAGKMPRTHYAGEMLKIVKDLRARYPGYREHIDQEVARVSGIQPANVHIATLLGAIQGSSTQQEKEANAVWQIMKDASGHPTVQALGKRFLAGDPSVSRLDVQQEWSRVNERKVVIEAENREIEGRAKTADDRKRSAGVYAERVAAVKADDAFTNIMYEAGFKTPAQFEQVVRDHLTGKAPISPNQARQIGEAIRAQRSVYQQAVWAEYTKGGENSVVARMGSDEAKKKLQTHMEMTYDRITEAIYNNDWGAAYTALNDVKALTSAVDQDLVRSPITGPGLLQIEAYNKRSPDIARDLFQRGILTNPNFNAAVKKRFSDDMARIMVQPDLRRTGTVVTPKEVVEQYRKHPSMDRREIYDLITSLPRWLPDPKMSDEDKLNLARGLFDPKNREFISLWGKNERDDRGRPVKNRMSIFLSMTNYDVAETMFRLGKMDKQAWVNYVNWTMETASKELINQDVKDLEAMGKFPGFSVRYDPENTRFEVIPAGTGVTDPTKSEGPISQGQIGRMQRANTVPGLQEAQRLVNRINMALVPIANIGKVAPGADVNAFVLGTFQDAGYNMSRAENPVSIPDQMWQEALKARMLKNVQGTK